MGEKLPFDGKLSGRIQGEVDAGLIADPLWVTQASLGPSLEDALDAEGEDLVRLQEQARTEEETASQPAPESGRRRRRRPTVEDEPLT